MVFASVGAQDDVDRDDGEWPRRVRLWLGFALLIAVQEVALRAVGATWWAARGGDPGAAPMIAAAVVDAVGIIALVLALAKSIETMRGWPIAMLLLVTVTVMHPIGYVLAFTFHEPALALAWSSVSMVAIAAVIVIERRRRVTAMLLGLTLAASAGFAASMLAVTL